ncbi:MAG: protein-glutamate O-methyltransferase CheR [Desulforegulaceae bacterium]|nr:protein-glutamate O-methyltransferase CheR [Desulforegulaceae bacterium]
MIKIKPNEYEVLRTFIKKQCGINLGGNKSYLIETRLSDLVLEYGHNNYLDFYKKAEKDPALVERIIDAMTTNETFWFRDTLVWKAISDIIIPQIVEKAKTKKKVRVWFGACSTGQEVYSFLMMLNEHLQKTGQKYVLELVELIATDISPSVLFQAKSGRYSGISMERGLPQFFKEKYFVSKEKVWLFDPNLRKRVNFKKLNLQESFVSLGNFDLVFLRNVLIYFSAETKKEIIKKTAARMAAGSPLILGSTESIRDFSNEFSISYKNNVMINYKK